MRDVAGIASLRELGAWLRLHIRAQGLSVKELAARTGVGQSTIYNWLNGVHLPNSTHTDERFYRLLALEEMGLSPRDRHALDETRIRLTRTSNPPPLRGLPAAVADFTGRRPELSKLDDVLRAHRRTQAVVLSAVSGTGGVGKTALAVHWAHSAKVRKAFPDGYLYVNLQGYSSTEPLTSRAALTQLLLKLGVQATAIPWDIEAMGALYQDLLNGRSTLLVLDNALDEPQVRPLLPVFAGCLALVTSRDRLLGLVARDGAVPLSLDRLPMREAVALLRRLLAAQGIEAEDVLLEELAEACARLPLALRIAAAAIPRQREREFVSELSRNGLDLLEVSPTDSTTCARAVFSWSVGRLSPASARAFRLLGAHPGHDWDIMAGSALLDAPEAEARDLVRDLLDQSLLETDGTAARFAMHDLLREYAGELATASAHERLAAADRLLDHYVHTAYLAKDIGRPWDAPADARIPGRARYRGHFEGPESAERWLAAERPNLVAATELARDLGRADHAGSLSAVLWRLLYMGGHHDDALTVHGSAREASRKAGDRRAEAAAEFRLGDVYWRIGDLESAGRHFETALGIRRKLGDGLGVAHVLSGIGTIHQIVGDFQAALRCHREGLDLAREAADWQSEIVALSNLAEAERGLGRLREALDCYGQVRALEDEHDDRESMADTLTQLGRLLLDLGRVPEASHALTRGHELASVLGNKAIEALAWGRMGVLVWHDCDPGKGEEHLREALDLMSRCGDRAYEAELLNHLGELSEAQGAAAQARWAYGQALESAQRVGGRPERERAQAGLTRVQEP